MPIPRREQKEFCAGYKEDVPQAENRKMRHIELFESVESIDDVNLRLENLIFLINRKNLDKEPQKPPEVTQTLSNALNVLPEKIRGKVYDALDKINKIEEMLF